MPPLSENADGRYVLRNLCELQKKWERKLPYLTQQGRGPWARCVLFAIEIARNRIAEDCSGSIVKLNALLKEWEHIRKDGAVSNASDSIKGVDFGIRLVVRRIRRCLLRSVQQHASKSANGHKRQSDIKRGA